VVHIATPRPIALLAGAGLSADAGLPMSVELARRCPRGIIRGHQRGDSGAGTS